MIKRSNQKNKKGFSLIELIIVLAVMAIIALIAIPNFTAVKENAKRKSDVQSANAISRSIETLIVDESIKVATTGTIKITMSSGTATAVVSDITTDPKVFTNVEALQDYVEALIDKDPQEDGKAGYLVTITGNKVETKSATTEELQ